MKTCIAIILNILCLFFLFLLITGCSTPSVTEEPEPETPLENVVATQTPTAAPDVSVISNENEDNRCKDLAGEIEVFVLVGPAAAVGLEPFAVGSIPFAVSGQGPLYPVEGGGSLQYYEILAEEWGTYEVTFEMDTVITGACSGERGSETLSVTLQVNGEQNVIVDSGDFYGEYPWSGSYTFDLNFPLEDGARVEGEGYIYVLHLNE